MKRGGLAGTRLTAFGVGTLVLLIIMDAVLVWLFIGGGLDIASLWPAP
jgi:hypothetical protein